MGWDGEKRRMQNRKEKHTSFKDKMKESLITQCTVRRLWATNDNPQESLEFGGCILLSPIAVRSSGLDAQSSIITSCRQRGAIKIRQE